MCRYWMNVSILVCDVSILDEYSIFRLVVTLLGETTSMTLFKLKSHDSSFEVSFLPQIQDLCPDGFNRCLLTTNRFE